MMMSFVIGGPTQQPPALPRNLTQSLGLPNYTSQYGSGLAQDLRGQLFLFTGNPAASPLIETMAYSQIPNFTMPVAQFNPNNPLNFSIDSLYNAPLLQNGALGGGGLGSGTGNVLGQMLGTAGQQQQTGSIFAPQQQQQPSGFPQFANVPQVTSLSQSANGSSFNPYQQAYGFVPQQPMPQPVFVQQQGSAYQYQPQTGAQSLVEPVSSGVSQQQYALQNLVNPMSLSQYTNSPLQTTQGYTNPTMQGYGMQGGVASAQGFGYGYTNPTMQSYGMQGASAQGFGYGNASPTMQGYGMPQQQQYNPYIAQRGYAPYATAGGQIIFQ